ncbi:IS3 family transposase [Vitreoscilla massiliensis]|uniref:IS3 family transposase n=4 Tax=Vitreoscilla massiliensis TaxID=1689272 RepID=A0ABY4E609_9NEIS|nr:IS3 family transposase [Vitreoscilla massiliensis]UOO91223.1 IS3 family transposase [Vitreoscilla massiliensis]UOO91228.1 IS3 family transposase [Vitreoscilla massiliensis]UOO91229.1 IS3 family transposase [Vitreoscilla massiliensis]UOO91250.1 IS3 family transposase [Vitreoscilla massiliensis]UOO91301.1 IS3 family transposase [Vitreoscilla massiliensis]
MMAKKSPRRHSDEFKQETVDLVLKQGYSVADAARAVGITPALLYKWKAKLTEQPILNDDEKAELLRLRKEIKQLRMEQEIFKKGQRLLCEAREVRYNFIQQNQRHYPIKTLCKVMKVSVSAYYALEPKRTNLVEVGLQIQIRALFNQHKQRIGSRTIKALLQQIGFQVGRYKVRSVMRKLGLVCQQRQAFKVTTKRNERHQVQFNLLNQNFQPLFANEVWAGDITYIKTSQGWRYLAVVMDLFSRRIVGWSMAERMKADLVIQALQQAHVLRQPQYGCVFHSDRGSQYTSRAFAKKASQLKMRLSMSDMGCCYDNAVVERFFGSLKYEGLGHTTSMNESVVKQEITQFIHYYNFKRPHTANNGMSPLEYENSQIKVSCAA